MQSTKIYVGQLDYSIDDSDLTDNFQQYGAIDRAFVVKDRETKRSRGFGFVTFKDAESAQKSLQAHGTHFCGRSIVVNLAKENNTQRAW